MKHLLSSTAFLVLNKGIQYTNKIKLYHYYFGDFRIDLDVVSFEFQKKLQIGKFTNFYRIN